MISFARPSMYRAVTRTLAERRYGTETFAVDVASSVQAEKLPTLVTPKFPPVVDLFLNGDEKSVLTLLQDGNLDLSQGLAVGHLLLKPLELAILCHEPQMALEIAKRESNFSQYEGLWGNILHFALRFLIEDHVFSTLLSRIKETGHLDLLDQVDSEGRTPYALAEVCFKTVIFQSLDLVPAPSTPAPMDPPPGLLGLFGESDSQEATSSSLLDLDDGLTETERKWIAEAAKEGFGEKEPSSPGTPEAKENLFSEDEPGTSRDLFKALAGFFQHPANKEVERFQCL